MRLNYPSSSLSYWGDIRKYCIRISNMRKKVNISFHYIYLFYCPSFTQRNAFPLQLPMRSASDVSLLLVRPFVYLQRIPKCSIYAHHPQSSMLIIDTLHITVYRLLSDINLKVKLIIARHFFSFFKGQVMYSLTFMRIFRLIMCHVIIVGSLMWESTLCSILAVYLT